MDPVRLAIDVGPLYGHRTGVGARRRRPRSTRSRRDGVDARPVRGELPADAGAPTRRLPMPAASPIGCGRAPIGRASTGGSGGAEVVHGTNYVVPPTRCRRSCRSTTAGSWRTPSDAAPTCAAPATVLRRRVADGAYVARRSDATTADMSANCSGPSGSTTIHLGPPPAPPLSPDDRRRAWPGARRSAVRARDRHGGTSQGAATLVAAFGAIAARAPHPPRDRRRRGRRRRRVEQSDRRARPASARAGRCARTGRRRDQALAAARARCRSPTRRSTRGSVSRSSRRSWSARRSSPAPPARSPRSAATAPRSSTVDDADALARRPRTGVVADDELPRRADRGRPAQRAPVRLDARPPTA